MESRNNLLFFLQHGVRPDDGAHYIVTVQADNATLVSCAQPVFKQVHFVGLSRTDTCSCMQASALGSEVFQNNVRFLSHANVCYDWCAGLRSCGKPVCSATVTPPGMRRYELRYLTRTAGGRSVRI